MGVIEFKLSEVMGRHRIKQRQLAEAAGVRPAAINALYHGTPGTRRLGQLGRSLDGLNALTGKSYSVSDLLAYKVATAQETVEESALMAVAAAELRGQLEALEADTSPDQLKRWAAAFEVPA